MHWIFLGLKLFLLHTPASPDLDTPETCICVKFIHMSNPTPTNEATHVNKE